MEVTFKLENLSREDVQKMLSCIEMSQGTCISEVPPPQQSPVVQQQSPVVQQQAPVVPPQQHQQSPVVPPPSNLVTSQAPVAPLPVYSFDQLQAACASLMDNGQASALQGLLAKYQINRLPDLNPPYYGAFATDLRALGARI